MQIKRIMHIQNELINYNHNKEMTKGLKMITNDIPQEAQDMKILSQTSTKTHYHNIINKLGLNNTKMFIYTLLYVFFI